MTQMRYSQSSSLSVQMQKCWDTFLFVKFRFSISESMFIPSPQQNQS